MKTTNNSKKTKFIGEDNPTIQKYIDVDYSNLEAKEYDKNKPLTNALAELNKPELDYRITSQTVDFVVEHLNIKSFRGQFGGSYMNQKNVYLGRFFVPNFINNTWGIFATERYVKQHIELEII